MKRIWHLLATLILLFSTITFSTASASSQLKIGQLKMSLNQLVRQQNAQLTLYKSQLESATVSELRESVFALSEVFHQCTLSWAALQTQYNAMDSSCTSQAPHTPESIAKEAEADLNKCLAVVEMNFQDLISPIDESLAAETKASSSLNFWLQAKAFARSMSTSRATSLDTFDAVAVSREIFNEAVLWDNLGSIHLYRSVRNIPGPLTNAGESGFFCGYSSFNKLFGKLKKTEAFLNTNCAGTKNEDRGYDKVD